MINDSNYREIVRKLVTETSRVSKGVNLQNIASKGEGERIRKCFVPSPDHLFIGADLSQAEPRVQAHIMWTKYNDNSLRQIFIDGQDLYTTMAMVAFDLPEEYCLDGSWYDPVSKTGGTVDTKDQAPPTAFFPRKMMKQGILALGYQQTERRFAETMNVSLEIANMVFEKFDKSFPSFKQMVQDTVQFMRENGYVETIFGRKRRFPEYKKLAREVKKNEPRLIELYRRRKREKNNPKIQAEIDELRKKKAQLAAMEREAFNAVIQGSATSDIIKINGNRIARICMERGWKMVASIHDEIIIEVPIRDVTMETISLFQDVMCNSVDDIMTVPLKSDVVIMPRWMEEYKPEDWDFVNCRPKKGEVSVDQ